MHTSTDLYLTSTEAEAEAQAQLERGEADWFTIGFKQRWGHNQYSRATISLNDKTARKLLEQLTKAVAQADCPHEATTDDGYGLSTCMECGYMAEDEFFFEPED